MRILETSEAACPSGATLAIDDNPQLGTLPMVTSTVVCFFVIVDAFMRSPANMTMRKRTAAKFHADPRQSCITIFCMDPIREVLVFPFEKEVSLLRKEFSLFKKEVSLFKKRSFSFQK